MSDGADLASRLGGVIVSLRSELKITRTLFQGAPYYIVRDPITFQAHRLPPEEYEILVALQDQKPLGQVFDELIEAGKVTTEDQDGFYRFILNLHRIGLLNLPIPDHSTLYQRYELKQKLQRKQKIMGFLFMQVPLAAPDVFLDRYIRYVRPIFSRLGFVVYSLLLLGTAGVLWARWKDVTAPLLTLLDFGNLPWLAAILIGLKLFHELGHAFACKAFGGRVPEMGAIFIVGTPCAYVDASAAWGFPRKLHRIVVSLAGMYVETAIGALALFVWAATSPSFLNSLAYQTFMMSTVVTVLFNINPLMRYDGYYVLSDLLEVPNLRARCQARVTSWLKHLTLGLPRTRDEFRPALGAFLTGFGIASAIYKFTLVTGICALIATKVYFLGVALAGFYLTTTVGGMFLKLVGFLFRSEDTLPIRRRAAIVGGLAIGVLPTVVAVVPVSLSARPTGVVSAQEERVLRTRAAGFLSEVGARVGSQVPAGGLVFRLRNTEIEERATEAAAELEILDLEIHTGAVLDRRAARQKTKQRNYFHELYEDARRELAELDVRAEEGGRVLRLDVQDRIGAFFKEGSEVGLVGRGPWVGKFLLEERTFAYCDIEEGMEIECRAADNPRQAIRGTLVSIGPAASREIQAEALMSLGGGQIVVDPTSHLADRAYFELVVAFAEEDREHLRHGLTLVADIDAQRMPIYRHVYMRVLSFLDSMRLS